MNDIPHYWADAMTFIYNARQLKLSIILLKMSNCLCQKCALIMDKLAATNLQQREQITGLLASNACIKLRHAQLIDENEKIKLREKQLVSELYTLKKTLIRSKNNEITRAKTTATEPITF